MESEYVVRLIYEYNPHLRGGSFVVPEFRRNLFFELRKWIPKKQAMAVVGLRRVGKTTLLRQIMAESLDDSVFFSFDEEEMQKKEVLVFVLDYILANLKPKRIFLDEIHYVDDWEGVLKRYYDQKGVKFVLSGSESLELSKAKSALAGRLVTFRLDSLRFSEYMGLKGEKIPPAPQIEDFPAVEAYYLSLTPEKERYEKEFTEYLFKGAFPEIVAEDDESVIRRYISDLVVKKIIYRDIPSIFEVRRKDLLYAIFRYACNSSSNLFDVKNLASTFSANQETVANYLSYLHNAFLLKTSEVYSKSPAKTARRNKKLHVTHPAIAFAVLGYSRSLLVEKILGQYVESLLSDENFWRDKQKNEVDIVLKKQPLLPVEVKFQNQVSGPDLKGLLKFMEIEGLGKGVVVTKNVFEKKQPKNKQILVIPAWLYSLLQVKPPFVP